MTAFTTPIRPEDVRGLMDLTVLDDPATVSMASLQQEGIAALHNIFCAGDVAYLADEVGMGKTYQAMGLAAVLWSDKPDARVLFISPRENLQMKWLDDYRRFFADNYRRPQGLGDDLISSVLFRQPVHRPVKFDNLRSWTWTIGRPEPMAAFLRHTSFTRPVFLTPGERPDVDALWAETSSRFVRWGLFDVPRPDDLLPDTVSRCANVAFADAVNRRLRAVAGSAPYFDLVVMDECQCLRHPGNQTNEVLHRMLKGTVGKWLFMSATPAHSGACDIPTIVNHYPGVDQLLDPGLVTDLPAMQHQMQRFMVRRQRTYRTGGTTRPTHVAKTEYRTHDLEHWAVRDSDMSAVSTLAMAVVQKALVDILKAKGNKYRIGFLSSFESLQASVKRHEGVDVDEESGDVDSDWHYDVGGSTDTTEAPDTGFIDRIAADFDGRFGMPLPHAKVDAVIDRIAPAAFGTDDDPGGHKHLIFTRRVSTVEALRDRLQRRYLRSIERRAERYWHTSIDWTGTQAVDVPEEDDEDPEAVSEEAGNDLLRRAMGPKAWLGRYRQTFRTTGRNALVFEDGWLSRLCDAGGVSPSEAATALPDEIWAESWTHASKASGARRSQHRADRMRYLAVQGVRRTPGVFGLTPEAAQLWQSAYETILHAHVERADPDTDARRDAELFTVPTLWTTWDTTFAVTGLALPAADPAVAPTVDELCQRQVARTLLGQVFRLTDTLVDLYLADERGGRQATSLPATFLEWASSTDPCAVWLRRDCSQWLAQLRLIVDSSLDGAGKTWATLAREETWPQLFNLSAVMGVTGGSGAQKTATRQFRTPSIPRVIVCTDTLKEGVDLHLFCDRVLHYGVAWTSGDLEQRVGRVDRFFSQIERRLRDEGQPPDVHLHVGYPHVVASLERSQVQRVRARQRRAEELMDSPLAGQQVDSKEFSASDVPLARNEQPLGAFLPRSFPSQGRTLTALSQAESHAIADHYTRWYEGFVGAVEARGWRVTPPTTSPTMQATIGGPNRIHEVEWTFDAALQRYVLTLTAPERPDDTSFSGGRRRRLRERRWVDEGFLQALIPRLDEPHGDAYATELLDALEGGVPAPSTDAQPRWSAALQKIASGEVTWLSEHKARLNVRYGIRSHDVTLYAYESGVRVIGVIASHAELRDRGPWTGTPNTENLRRWALDTTGDLGLGYIDAHDRDGLVFGVHVLHDALTDEAMSRLVEEVAWRSDAWEAALTGQDTR